MRPRLMFVAAYLSVALCGCSDPGAVKTQAKLRQAPANESQVLATIPKGGAVAVKGCANGWCHVSWNGRDGYVLTKDVRLGDSAGRTTDVDKSANENTEDDDDTAVPDSSGGAR